MSRPLRAPFVLAAVFGLGLLLAPAHAPANERLVRVTIDEATLMRLPEKVGTIIVGNPMIADVSLQSSGLVVVTGKGYGSTNLVALDRDGNVLTERSVLVSGPRERVVVVHRGTERQTYSCEPNCEPRITLGDFNDNFTTGIGQSVARSTGAASSGAAAGAR